jgi:hypothetical protein
MREIRLSGSVEGVVSNHDPYSDCLPDLGSPSHRACRAFSDFLVFRLTCEGPASATVCAGSA